MSRSQEQPERPPAARDRAAVEPVVTTSAERYVMSGGLASRLAVKEGDLFLYSNELGQVPGTENSVLGLYYRDTRYLSRHEVTIAGRQPVLLSASADRGYAATVELTNLEARTADGHTLPQASVHLRRTRFVADRLYELLRVRNHHDRHVELVVDCTSTPTSPTCSRSAAAGGGGAGPDWRRRSATGCSRSPIWGSTT